MTDALKDVTLAARHKAEAETYKAAAHEMAKHCDARIEAAAEVLRAIDAMPFVSVNDSESLRHTIRVIQTMARNGLAKLTSGK